MTKKASVRFFFLIPLSVFVLFCFTKRDGSYLILSYEKIKETHKPIINRHKEGRLLTLTLGLEINGFSICIFLNLIFFIVVEINQFVLD